jgi:hypothetical protein
MVVVRDFVVVDGALQLLDRDRTPKALSKASEEAHRVSKGG